MFVSSLLVFIAAFDIRTHRIPNSALLLLVLVSIAENSLNFSLKVFVVSSCMVLIFTLISGCGYGDSKLSIILLNFVVPSYQLLNYLSALLVVSALLVLVQLIRNRSMRGEIAFAPALCGAVLVLAPLSGI